MPTVSMPGNCQSWRPRRGGVSAPQRGAGRWQGSGWKTGKQQHAGAALREPPRAALCRRARPVRAGGRVVPGVSFRIVDMIAAIDAADWLMLVAAGRLGPGPPAIREIALAERCVSERLARLTDAALQVQCGTGLMNGCPIERFWRDARRVRSHDGTSEIERHIMNRERFRSPGAW